MPFKLSLLLSSLLWGIACQSPDHPTSTQLKKNKTSQNWCFSNGPIYTALDATPRASAVGVKNGVISYVAYVTPEPGWCEAQFGSEAHNIDLEGKALFPGFTDAHGHLLGIGLRELTLNLDDVTSIENLQDRLKAVVGTTPAGETIYGRGWIETHWPEKRFPTRYDLDLVSPDNPVILERADGHAVIVNSAALAAANITSETEPPFGGDILKDDESEPTGMLIDRAEVLVKNLMPKLTDSRKRQAYVKAGEVYASRGWTNIHSMSVDPDNIPMIEELSRTGELPIRVYNSVDLKHSDTLSKLPHHTSTSDRITTRAIKLYSDGALGSRGAALHAPYSDDPGNRGLMLITDNQIRPHLEAALKSGIQVNTHAIGDMANSVLLKWYENAFEAIPETERAIVAPRWRVEHAQILTQNDIKKFADLGVIPSMQPSHAIGDLHFAVSRLGPQRLAGGYAWQSLIDNGAIIAGGSDAPVEYGSPLIEFYAATVRQDLKGYSNANWYMNEKVSPQEALKMFTIWAAYAAFEEDRLGSIEVGKRADFTLFDTDIMTASPQDILSTKTVMTIVDGQAIYKAELHETDSAK